MSTKLTEFHLCTARAQAAELRFTQLKERHAELITSHADLMKKVNSNFVSFISNGDDLSFILKCIRFCVLPQNADTVKLLSNTKQSQDDLLRARQQLENELEGLRQEKRNMVGHTADECS